MTSQKTAECRPCHLHDVSMIDHIEHCSRVRQRRRRRYRVVQALSSPPSSPSARCTCGISRKKQKTKLRTLRIGREGCGANGKSSAVLSRVRSSVASPCPLSPSPTFDFISDPLDSSSRNQSTRPSLTKKRRARHGRARRSLPARDRLRR